MVTNCKGNQDMSFVYMNKSVANNKDYRKTWLQTDPLNGDNHPRVNYLMGPDLFKDLLTFAISVYIGLAFNVNNICQLQESLFC